MNGTNPAKPITLEQQLNEARSHQASPAKRARVEGYMHSDGIKQNFYNHKGKDCAKGLVSTKPQSENNAFLVS
jgi:hypothetical protein